VVAAVARALTATGRAAGIGWAKCAGRRPDAVIPSKKSPRP
jgi:hypothetical protein